MNERILIADLTKPSLIRIKLVRWAHDITQLFRNLPTANLSVLLRLKSFVRIFQESLAVGVYRRHEILAAVEQSYSNAPEFYSPENYTTQVEKELLPILQKLAVGGPMLDLYSGQGREAEIFAEAGYSVTCIERVAESAMLGRKRAQKNAFDAKFLVADIENEEWEPPHTNWIVIYTSLWMLSTIPDREYRRKWLKRLQSFGEDRAVFVVSVTLRRNEWAARMRYLWSSMLRIATLNSRKNEYGDYFSAGIFWHEFHADEAKSELESAGFEILAEHESTDPSVPTCNFYFLRRSDA